MHDIPDLATATKDEGAGDQGILFGYFTNETDAQMPALIQNAHADLCSLAEVRKNGTEPTLGLDAKSQLSVSYKNGKPVGVTSIFLSTRHLHETIAPTDVRAVVKHYIRKILQEGGITPNTIWYVNPTGKLYKN